MRHLDAPQPDCANSLDRVNAVSRAVRLSRPAQVESEPHASALDLQVYRYRLIDQRTGDDLGPFVSLRLTFAAGESIERASGESFLVVNTVEPENENFRAYVVVRRIPG